MGSFVGTAFLLNSAFLEERFEKQLPSRDQVLVHLLQSIWHEEATNPKREAISVILCDLWLSRLNLSTVFIPSDKSSLNIPRFGDLTLLDPLYKFEVLQVLLCIVRSWNSDE